MTTDLTVIVLFDKSKSASDMNDKSLNLSVIFCSFILSEKYLIVKKYSNLPKKKK